MVQPESLPIYLLPGMTPQYPVYSRLLPLLPNARIVQFIEPSPTESLSAYAQRMAIQFNEPCFIGGVSFGGILAQEIARLINPVGCIVIASVQAPSQLPPWFRVWRMLGGRHTTRLLSACSALASMIPKPVHSQSTTRLRKIAGPAGSWHRWATAAVVDWMPAHAVQSPLVHIHGDADTTFPIRYTSPGHIIRRGRHALPISHPVETAEAIKKFIAKITCASNGGLPRGEQR